MEDAWDGFGNGRTPHIGEIGKNLQDIAGGHGYLDATSLQALCTNMGGNGKAHNNCITFQIRSVMFLEGGKSKRKELLDGGQQISIPKGDACAEHVVYRNLLGNLVQGEHLTINQSKAPCGGCLNKLQGLAHDKHINIVVHYDDAYDLLNKPNGNVFISNTGRISWQH